MKKSICFAYYGDGKFIGWYADSFGSIRKTPKVYSNLETMLPVITKNFRYKIKEAKDKLWNLVNEWADFPNPDKYKEIEDFVFQSSAPLHKVESLKEDENFDAHIGITPPKGNHLKKGYSVICCGCTEAINFKITQGEFDRFKEMLNLQSVEPLYKDKKP